MFDKRTVFVVGAGASCELGLPAGDGLMDKIAKAVAPARTDWGFGNDELLRTIAIREQARVGVNWGGAVARFRTAAGKLSRALPYARSIDTYLESQQEDEDTVFLGKLAIAQTILQAERASHLYRGRDQSAGAAQGKLADSWYPPLARLLNSGHHAGDLSGLFQNVSFVVFNYDRCLEVFLHRMVKDYFDATDAEADEAMKGATIVHAYGQVGYMPWQRSSTDQHFTPLGGGEDVNLAEIADGIKTYSESADSNTKRQIGDLMAQAETMIFMGFGFIAQNMQLLAPSSDPVVKKIFATAFRLSPNDQLALSSKLEKAYSVQVGGLALEKIPMRETAFRFMLEVGTCRELMDHNIFSFADQ